MNFNLRPYQKPHAVALAQALTRHRAALDASDTGTGKTFVALFLAQWLKCVPLVICPKSVRQDWLRATAVAGIHIEVVNYEKVRGVRRTQFDHSQGDKRLSRSEWGFEERAGAGTRWRWVQPYELIIFDEVDRCGGNTSLNSKLLIAAKRQAKFVLCLSATAADNPLQLKALGYTLGLFTLDSTRNGFRWWIRNHACKPGVFGGFEFTRDPEAQKRAMAKINAEIFGQGRGSRMRKAEIPGFPQTLVDVKLIEDDTGKARRAAQELRNEFEERGDLELMTALRQKLELLKVPALAELAQHYAKTSRVIIFVNYRITITALQDALVCPIAGYPPAITGDNDEAEREDIKRRFQANEIPVLLCNIQAGGVGIGLHDPTGKVERTTLISPSYSARLLKQALGRTPRDGGAFSQQFLVYFADTLEADIAAAVRGKLGNLDALNDAILHGVITHHDLLSPHNPNPSRSPHRGHPTDSIQSPNTLSSSFPA